MANHYVTRTGSDSWDGHEWHSLSYAGARDHVSRMKLEDGKWIYIEKNGVRVNGWLRDVNGKWYPVDV